MVPSDTSVVRRPSDEVATLVRAVVPPGERRRPYEKVAAPVPPLDTARVPVVSERAMPREDVALSVYPLDASPMRICPYEGAEVSPVPP